MRCAPRIALLLLPIVLLQACAGMSRPRYGYDRATGTWKGAGGKKAGTTVQVPAEIGDGEKGIASFYAEEFAGKPTASGEPFDPSALTCAHRTYPFGTKLKVTSAKTGKSTVVRVNDRGPHVDGRIVDLSRAAAEEIGLTGTGEVVMEVVP